MAGSSSSTSYDTAFQEFVKWKMLAAQQAANQALAGPGGPYGGVPGQRPMGPMAGAWGLSPAAGGGSWFTGPQTMSVGDQAAAFFNPFQQQVVDATRGDFAQLRQEALNRTRQEATLGGGFGGTRMAVLAGSRLGELDRAEASQLAGLRYGGYQNAVTQGTAYAERQRQLAEQQLQEPLFRQRTALEFANAGQGVPTQTTYSQSYSQNPLLQWGALALGAWDAWRGQQNNPLAMNPYAQNPFAYGPTQPMQFGGAYQPGQSYRLSNGDYFRVGY